METTRYDHLVIGSGLAGLSFAIEMARHGRVCVLTKAEVSESNTTWAQGGIAAAVGEADSWELHERDTLVAGAGECNPAAVRFLVQNAGDAIRWLQDMGTRFDVDGNGLALGREGGHSLNRIVHHSDKTGWEVERAMVERVVHHPNIDVFEKTFATELLMHGGRCVGAVAHIDALGTRAFVARSVMLATGGCGRMYQHTTNPRVATGDGIALACRIGAKVENMEFMQFHPTTLFHPQLRSFLISEAVRGAGATLRNHLGRRFMYDYDPRMELAPRDVVARAIEAEMKKHGTWCVYLDLTHVKPEGIRAKFPTIYETLAKIGLEMEKEWIPVVPAQHYSCGGVVTDLDGRTNIPGLFAAGEVACTGVHGANRLASNSLLEAMVFARAASKVADREDGELPAWVEPHPFAAMPEAESIRIRRACQRTMTNHVGIVRSFEGLAEAEETLLDLVAEAKTMPNAPFSTHPLETRNLMDAALYVVRGALARKANVGLHYNIDLIGETSPSTLEPRPPEATS